MFFWRSKNIFVNMPALVIAYVKLSENKPSEAESIKKEIQPFNFISFPYAHQVISHCVYCSITQEK